MKLTIKAMKLKLEEMKENYSELLKVALPKENRRDVEMAISVIEAVEKYVNEDLEYERGEVE